MIYNATKMLLYSSWKKSIVGGGIFFLPQITAIDLKRKNWGNNNLKKIFGTFFTFTALDKNILFFSIFFTSQLIFNRLSKKKNKLDLHNRKIKQRRLQRNAQKTIFVSCTFGRGSRCSILRLYLIQPYGSVNGIWLATSGFFSVY